MPFLPASSSEIWFTDLIGSSTSTRSTTVSVWKTSTTPFSSLYVASMARSGPKCFLAACAIAFWRVSTRTLRSMPLSLATWSRIMFRLTIGAWGAGAAIWEIPSWFIKHRFGVGLADLRVRDVEQLAVHVDCHLPFGETLEGADEGLAVLAFGDRSVGLQTDLLPCVFSEVLRRAQRAVEAGARDLEVVGALERILDVERRADAAREG